MKDLGIASAAITSAVIASAVIASAAIGIPETVVVLEVMAEVMAVMEAMSDVMSEAKTGMIYYNFEFFAYTTKRLQQSIKITE